jgi:hypothetical protein
VKPDVCECCHYPAADLARVEPGLEGPGAKWLCRLCRSTWAGATVLRTSKWATDRHEALATTCFVGNAILDALARVEAEAIIADHVAKGGGVP